MSKRTELSSKKVHYADLRDGELRHWKYIKREKLPSGDWKYYYHDDKYEKISKEYTDAREKADAARKISRSYREFVRYYQAQLDKKNNGDLRVTDSDENLKNWKKMRDAYADEHTKAAQYAARLKKRFEKADEVYQKSAGHKVADLLNKTSNTIYKAKRWLSKKVR